MPKNNLFLSIVFLIMFTCINLYSQTADINTLTVSKNSDVNNDKAPLQDDVVRVANLALGKEFSINLNTKSLDEFVRITSFGNNIDFVRFTRSKTNASITFKAIENGEASLNFQIDNNNNEVVRKYLYTINITNSIVKPNNQTKITTNDSSSKMSSIPKVDNVPKRVVAPLEKNANDNRENVATKNPKTANSGTQTTRNMAVVTPSPTLEAEKSLYNRASELKRARNYSNSINAYSNLINEYTNSIYKLDSIFDLANIYTIQGDYENAKSEYEKIINDKTSTDDKKSLAMNYNANILKLEDNYDNALNEYLKVYNLYSNSKNGLNAAYEYANLLKTKDNISEGFDVLNDALSKNINFDQKENALMLLAEIYEKGNANIRNYEKSYNTYRAYLEEFPNGERRKEAYDRYAFIESNYLNIR